MVGGAVARPSLHSGQALDVPPDRGVGVLTSHDSIRINDQWRMCFEWIDQDAYNVESVD
jgi:plasmid maintenance system killer protein